LIQLKAENREQLVTNQNWVHKCIKSRMDRGNACCYRQYTVICPRVPVNNIKIQCTELQVCLLFRMGVTLGLPN